MTPFGESESRTCENCGGEITASAATYPQAGTINPKPCHVHDRATLYENYRCPHCRAGGTLVRDCRTAEVVRRVGPAFKQLRRGDPPA